MLNVLIVEDYAPLRALYSRFLEYTDHHTIQVRTYHAAIEHLEVSVPDALVVDLSLSDGNGWSLVRGLGRQRRFEDAQIVALIEANGDLTRLQSYGIEHVLSKSAPAPKLLTLLSNLASARHDSEQTQSKLARSA